MLNIIQLAFSQCKLQDKSKLYFIEDAIECIMVPQLTVDEFRQNQQSVEALMQMYVFLDTTANFSGSSRIDTLEELGKIRAKYEQKLATTGCSAYDYYADLSNLFQSLRDPHTGYAHQSFFGIFTQVLPVQFVVADADVYLQEVDDQSKLGLVKKAYYSQFGALQISQSDKIITINNQKPLQYLQYLADRYIPMARSSHGRLNYLLSGSVYEMSLKFYKMLNVEDRTLQFAFASGKTMNVKFTIRIEAPVDNETTAAAIYSSFLKKSSPYSLVEKDKSDIRSPEERSPLSVDRHVGQSPEFSPLLSSPGFYDLIGYQTDFVLSVYGFPGGNYSVQQALVKSVVSLQNYLRDNLKNRTLFISMLGNGGGWVVLSDLFAQSLFPNNYPIFGRYSQRKAPIVELLMRSNSQFTQMYRFGWISGAMYTIPSNEQSMTWYEAVTTKQTHTDYYGMTLMDPETKLIADQILNSTPFANPNQIVILTDATCGSACASAVKRLSIHKNAFVIGLGGYGDEPYDVASFAGGNMMDSVMYEQVLQKQTDFKNLSSAEVSDLKKVWIPHDGFLRFAMTQSFAFDDDTPLEFRVVRPNVVLKVWPEVNAANYLRRAVGAARATTIQWFGPACKTVNGTIFRALDGACAKPLPHSCEYGRYMSGSTCLRRVDQLVRIDIVTPVAETNMWLLPAVSGVSGAVVAVGVVFLTQWLIRKKAKKGAYQDLGGKYT